VSIGKDCRDGCRNANDHHVFSRIAFNSFTGRRDIIKENIYSAETGGSEGKMAMAFRRSGVGLRCVVLQGLDSLFGEGNFGNGIHGAREL
jgi:hypothetical protein